MLSTLTPDTLIPADHPIRRIKPIVEAVLRELSPGFDTMYASTGRQSIPPEHLLKAEVLMALYSIRSERQFCERLRYDLLFRYFLDLNAEDEGFDHSTFSRNRERLLNHEIADRYIEFRPAPVPALGDHSEATLREVGLSAGEAKCAHEGEQPGGDAQSCGGPLVAAYGDWRSPGHYGPHQAWRRLGPADDRQATAACHRQGTSIGPGGALCSPRRNAAES